MCRTRRCVWVCAGCVQWDGSLVGAVTMPDAIWRRLFGPCRQGIHERMLAKTASTQDGTLNG